MNHPIETSEFHTEFHRETGTILRRRLIWFISIWGGLGLLGLVFLVVMVFGSSSAANLFSSGYTLGFVLLTNAVWVLCYITALVMAIEQDVSARRVIHLSMGLIVLDGVLVVLMRAADPGVMMTGMWYFVISHFVACCVFPWTLRQAIVPSLVVIGFSTLVHLVYEGTSPVGTLVLALVTLVFNGPGLGVAWFRYNQRVQKSTNKFLSKRYGHLRQELAYARQVHESLFPGPRSAGSVRFSYRYEPMRQIGGDYLHTKLHVDPETEDETFSCVLVDVTGHGIPAALTVNRLHGEIDLRFAEQPDIRPGELLRLLNRYINLTLSNHSIFATAVCIQVVPGENKLLYASGGHPPAFVRGVDGTVRDLDPTAFVLGATGDHQFEHGEISVGFHPGDSLIAYTDGATEARAMDGSMLRVEGLRRIIAGAHVLGSDEPVPLQGQWSERILSEVAAHRGGLPPDDDTLAIEIFRPLKAAEKDGDAPGTAAAETAEG